MFRRGKYEMIWRLLIIPQTRFREADINIFMTMLEMITVFVTVPAAITTESSVSVALVFGN